MKNLIIIAFIILSSCKANNTSSLNDDGPGSFKYKVSVVDEKISVEVSNPQGTYTIQKLSVTSENKAPVSGPVGQEISLEPFTVTALKLVDNSNLSVCTSTASSVIGQEGAGNCLSFAEACKTSGGSVTGKECTCANTPTKKISFDDFAKADKPEVICAAKEPAGGSQNTSNIAKLESWCTAAKLKYTSDANESSCPCGDNIVTSSQLFKAGVDDATARKSFIMSCEVLKNDFLAQCPEPDLQYGPDNLTGITVANACMCGTTLRSFYDYIGPDGSFKQHEFQQACILP